MKKPSIASLFGQLALFSALALTGPAAFAAPAAPDVNTAIHQLVDALNSGNSKAFTDGFAKNGVSITDDMAPHLFTGPNALKQWFDAFDRDAKARNLTDPVMPYSEPTRSVVDNKSAYVVMPATYSYKLNGVPTAEDGSLVFVMDMTPKGWKVRAMTWTGSVPHATK